MTAYTDMNRRLLVSTFLCMSFVLPGCASDRSKTIDTGLKTGVGSDAGKRAETEPDSTYPKSGEVATLLRPNFSGTWNLNKELSDDPRKKVQDAMKSLRNSRSGSSGTKGGGRGGHRAGGPAGGMTGRGDSQPEDMQALLRASSTLQITHEDPMLLVVTDDGGQQRLFTDFRGASVSAGGGMQQKVTIAGWEHGVLVVETTSNSGPRLIQRYKLNANTNQLMISAEITPPGLAEPVVVNRVYDAVSSHTKIEK